jgi:hypothetical protein
VYVARKKERCTLFVEVNPQKGFAAVNIYIICSVRKAKLDRTESTRAYAQNLREAGHRVHFPPDDAPQDDPTGVAICETHLKAMREADEVHVFWDVESFGSHFDLGMAYALGKRIVPISCALVDPPGKSYWKAVINR